jgi:hypothetical protein
MNPLRRELLNGLLVLVVASLLSVAFSAFQVSFNALLWVLILMAIAIAVCGYVVFEFVLSTESREMKTEQRELEWLKRIGTPARLSSVPDLFSQAVKTMSPGSDYTVMYNYGSEGGGESSLGIGPQAFTDSVDALLERVKQGKVREYKRIICFDRDVLANDPELRSGVLRVGEGPGTIDRAMGEHCRLMVNTKGCSLYVAPEVVHGIVAFFGVEKMCISVETTDQATGGRTTGGAILFYDPPNGEIIEQFRQMERETERRMVAVHTIRFPEDEAPTASPATRSPAAR